MQRQNIITLLALTAVLAVSPPGQAAEVTPAEARAIAKEAYIYGYPLVDNYRIGYITPDLYPPVNAFWSLTMYDLPQSLLVANPLNRYLINSPMLPELKKDADGGLTMYIQNESPGKDLEPNWLPAPKGPFSMYLRMYWPKEAALDGSWQAPKVEMVK
jgi:hypothetical protein